MKKCLLVLYLVIFLSSCTNETGALRILDGAGYTDIKFTGYQWFSCSEDDFYATGFIAKGPTGKKVEGCVCEGFLFKNSTIRLK